MIKSVDFTGKNEEDAVRNGLEALGLERDDVSVEVIERAKSGFLGIGGSPAVVRLTYGTPEPEKPEPRREPEKPAAPQKQKRAEPEKKPAPEKRPVFEAKPIPEKKPVSEKPAAPVKTPAPVQDGLSEKGKSLEAFLNGLFERMGVSAVPVITESEDGISVVLTGDDPGALIGRRGETLDAVQHLANYAMNRGSTGRTRISIDAENYRERRNEALERLAEKVAAKVIKYRRSMTLEPMNSYERHIIHTALQNTEGVTTYSVGSEPNRRVVVACERGGAPTGGRRAPEGKPRYQQQKPRFREEPREAPVSAPQEPPKQEPQYREWH